MSARRNPPEHRDAVDAPTGELAPKKPRLERLREYFAPRHWKAVHDRWLGIAAVLFAGIVPILVELYRGDADWLHITVGSLIAFSICLTGLALSLTKDLREMVERRDAEIDAELEKRFRAIATDFNVMSVAVSKHESTADAFIAAALTITSELELAKWFERLRTEWGAAAEAICNAGASVLPAKRGHRGMSDRPAICSANIKIVADSPDGEVYQVFGRSMNSELERLSDDAKPPRLLRRNKMYRELLAKNDDLTQGPQVHIIPNIEDYIRGVEKGDEPLPKVAEWYKSCMISPIFEGNSSRLVGIFCIDSREFDFFDLRYDKTVTLQLSNHALTCIRNHTRAQKAYAAAEQRLRPLPALPAPLPALTPSSAGSQATA